MTFSNDNSSFSIDKLKQIVSDSRETTKNIPCGLVFRIGLKEQILKKLSVSCVDAVDYYFDGVRVYFDNEQVEDCIEFTDREALGAYLNRQNDPKAWAMILIRFLPQPKDVNQFAIPPKYYEY